MSFIDIAFFHDWDPGPLRRSKAYAKRIIDYIKHNKYRGLKIWIGLRDYDREGADISACVYFEASGLEEFVRRVQVLRAVTSIDPNAFDAQFGKTTTIITEEDFGYDGELIPVARARLFPPRVTGRAQPGREV